MQLPYQIDDGIAARARFGLIVLKTDETIEHEFRRMINLPDVMVYCTRIESPDEVTEKSLATMAARIAPAAALLPPVPFDVVGYGCTSGTVVIGADNVRAAIRGARPASSGGDFADSIVSDPLTAVLAACRALSLRRLAFVTPYIAEVSEAMRTALQDGGLSINAFASFQQSEDTQVARITTASVYQALMQVGENADCDGVFISCTNLRTLDVIAAAEKQLGIPVLSSNQALAWHMLRSAGIDQKLPQFGRLFADQ